MIWGGADVIIIEIKCTINVMWLNHPETIPSPPPVHGKTIFHEIGPWCQKAWGPLGLQRKCVAWSWVTRKVKRIWVGVSLWGEFISKDWGRTGRGISMEARTGPSDNSHPNCPDFSTLLALGPESVPLGSAEVWCNSFITGISSRLCVVLGPWSISRWRTSMSLLPPSKSQPTRLSWRRARSMTASCKWRPSTKTAPPSTARFATMKSSQLMCLLPSTGMVSVLRGP